MLVSAVRVLTEMWELVRAMLALTGRPSNEATTVLTMAAKLLLALVMGGFLLRSGRVSDIGASLKYLYWGGSDVAR